MKLDRFYEITDKFPRLRVAVLGDFCLDRYLEIDGTKKEISIETRLPVYNVTNIRSSAGGAGTILNNLSALGVAQIFPIGFYGDDGEGFELQRAIRPLAGVDMSYFFQTTQRRTFTYCKPITMLPGKRPVEFNRLDFKNWTPTPMTVEGKVMDGLFKTAPIIDALILLDQVETPGAGVFTKRIMGALQNILKTRPQLPIIGDSRRNLKNFPSIMLKMNLTELGTMTKMGGKIDVADIKKIASTLAVQNQKPVVVTLAEHGMIGALPEGEVEYVPAVPVRKQIDPVGAGDAVTANLATSLAGGATLREAMEIASAAASVVIHQLGTTGTATPFQIASVFSA